MIVCHILCYPFPLLSTWLRDSTMDSISRCHHNNQPCLSSPDLWTAALISKSKWPGPDPFLSWVDKISHPCPQIRKNKCKAFNIRKPRRTAFKVCMVDKINILFQDVSRYSWVNVMMSDTKHCQSVTTITITMRLSRHDWARGGSVSLSSFIMPRLSSLEPLNLQ